MYTYAYMPSFVQMSQPTATQSGQKEGRIALIIDSLKEERF